MNFQSTPDKVINNYEKGMEKYKLNSIVLYNYYKYLLQGILLPTLPRRPCLDDATGLAEEIV